MIYFLGGPPRIGKSLIAKQIDFEKKCVEINDALLAKLAGGAPPAGGWNKATITKMGEYYRRQLKRFESGDPKTKAE